MRKTGAGTCTILSKIGLNLTLLDNIVVENLVNNSADVFKNIPVFDSVKSIQPVEMIPLSDSEGRTSIVPQEPETLFGGDR